MDREPLIKLTWHGEATVESIPALLDQADRIQIVLPAEYNHALFRTLHPDAPDAALESIDIDAGPEILDAVAKVNGLEALANLTTILDRAQASVTLQSPPTLIINQQSSPQR